MGQWVGRVAAVAAAALAVGGAPAVASAQGSVALTPLNNLIDVLVIDRELLAFDALGTRNFRARLELDEEVIWSGAQGLVGIVITDRRALAATPETTQWQELRWRTSETPDETALLSDRLALMSTHARVLAFDGVAGLWIESNIGPGEHVAALRAGENNGVVVTNRRALGIAPDSLGFFGTQLRLHENVERVSAESNLATIMTSQRILVFRSGVGSWSEVDRRIHR